MAAPYCKRVPTRNPRELPAAGRLLALDLGAKRVGVALSDSNRSVALSRGEWPRVWAELKQKIVAESNITAVVLGLPLDMAGTHGPSATAATSVADLIEKELKLPVLLWDERLTSRQAENAFFEQRTGRQTRASKRDSVGHVDSGAAVIMLQGVLDNLRAGGR